MYSIDEYGYEMSEFPREIIERFLECHITMNMRCWWGWRKGPFQPAPHRAIKRVIIPLRGSSAWPLDATTNELGSIF